MLDDILQSVADGVEHADLVFHDWFEEHKHEYKLFTYPDVGHAIRLQRTRESITIFGKGFLRTYKQGEECNIAKYNSGGIAKVVKGTITRIAKAGIHVTHRNFEYNLSLQDFIKLNKNDEPLKHQCPSCTDDNVGDNHTHYRLPRVCFHIEHIGLSTGL